jgi:opacity protein-like surface antigen
MKKNAQSFLILVSVLLFVNVVNAQSLFYLKGSLGPSFQRDNSFAGGNIDYAPSGLGAALFSLGLNIGPQLSAEIEFSARTNSINNIDGIPYTGDLDSSAVMLNGIYNLPLQMGYSLNFGAGFGVLSAEITDSQSGNYANGSTLATQLMVGFEAEVTDNLAFTFDYKHLSAFDLELTGTSGVYHENFLFKNGSVLVGLKYSY